MKIVRLLVAAVTVLATLALVGQAAGAGAARVSPDLDVTHGFPSWYQDVGGTRLAPCLDPGDPNCVLAGFTPNGPVSFPGNFPSEFFYSVADSDRIPTNGCSGTKRGTASVRLALEGAFLGGTPSPSDRMVFGRVRVRVTSGLCRDTVYRFVHPYGSVDLRTDSSGAIPANVGTVDIGCTPTPTVPCDFAAATQSPVFGSPSVDGSGFLRWDPTVAPAAPTGYLGDAATLHRVVGGSNGNSFTILTATGGAVGNGLSTNLFTVAGKVAGSLSAAPAAVDLGGQPLGGTATTTVSVTNVDSSTVALGAPTLTGPDAAQFAVADTGTCQATTELTRDQSCTVDVSFSPTGTVGQRSASLSVPSSGGVRSPLVVPVTGTAIEATDLPGIDLSETGVDFGSVRVRESGQLKTLTVTSNGTAPLRVDEVVFDPARAEGNANFRIVEQNCTTGGFLQPGATCTLGLQFAPLANGPQQGRLILASNAGKVSVDLTGVGTGGTAAVGPAGAYGFPAWYQDDAGVKLGQCIDPADAYCVVLGDPGYDPNQPLVFPDNFPSEYFYYMVDAVAPAQDTTCDAVQGTAGMRVATEAAFANGGPVDGDQMTFGRIRFRSAGGLCPNTDYLFVGPYGADTYRTDDTGALKPSPGTQDVGCAPLPGSPCDFAEALSSRVLSGFVKWDPQSGPAAPAGYLGDGVTPHAVVGAPYSFDGVTPANYFAVLRADTGAEVARTAQMAVMGRLDGPLVANPAVLGFGSVPAGTTTDRMPFELTNTGVAELSVGSLSLQPTQSAEFDLDAGDCIGAVLAPGGSCAGSVAFTPGGTGPRRASIVVEHSGANSPLSLALEGVGTTPFATFNASPAAVDLGAVHVDTSSQVETVTVSNVGGNSPLQVGGVQLIGADSDQFAIADNRCQAAVAPFASCEVDVVFHPTSEGVKTAALEFTDNAAGSPHTVGLSGSASASPAQVSQLIDGANGFPAFYSDGGGTRVEPCLDANDPLCVLAGFTPNGPLTFPDNFPDEFFYALADAEPVSVAPIAGCDTGPGTAGLRVALEGSFVNGAPVAGEQITFGRVRVVASGLCPRTPYTFETPYGPLELTADPAGAINAKDGTTDIGVDAPFAGALAAPIAESFPRWNPNVAPSAPEGYLGDPNVAHRIVGGTYTPAGAAGPFNGFAVRSAGGALLGSTHKFLVSGKAATGLRADSAGLDFGHVDVGASSAPTTVNVTNIGASDSVATVSITGADADQFQFTAGTCASGLAIAQDAACTVEVTFVPTTAGAKAAKLTITTVSGSRVVVPLAGTANAVGAPVASISPASLAFGSQPVGSQTAPQAVTLANTGTADLHISGISLSGAASTDFAVAGACGVVAPGASCTLNVTMTPTAAGSRTASLSIGHDAAGSPSTVPLSGTGVASTFSLSPTTVKFGKVAVNTTKTGSVSIKNTGTVPFTPTKAEVTGADASAFTVPASTCIGRSLAPGSTCNLSVGFRPTASGTTYTATLVVTGDASSIPATARATVTGTAR